jgi:hypothetical protein
VTRFELQGRKVIALGATAAGECLRHNIEHIAACHPSRRGYTNERNAVEIAEAIAKSLVLASEHTATAFA